jgi:hypothetical protein
MWKWIIAGLSAATTVVATVNAVKNGKSAETTTITESSNTNVQ